MPVYDDQQNGNSTGQLPNDDELRRITGINEEQESAHDRSAHNGAADDILNRENNAAKGGPGAGRFKGKSSANELGSQEKAGGLGDQLGKGFTGGKSGSSAIEATRFGRAKQFSARHKKGIFGSIFGSLLLGGGFGFMTIVSGPLQFVTIAHQMEDFHFSHMENQTDSRFSSMMRDLRRFNAVKNKSDWERSRMGILGNKFADKFATQLSAKGWTPETSNGGFHFEGWKIDPEKSPELKSQGSLEKQKTYMDQHYGVDTEIKDGQLFIKNQSTKGVSGYLKQQRLMRGMLSDAGYNKVVAAIGARAFAARYAITWHPLKNSLHRRTNESLTDFKKRLANEEAKSIYQGDPVEVAAEADQSSEEACKKPNSPACKDAKEKASQADERAKDASKYSEEGKQAEAGQENGDDGPAKSFRGKIAGSLTKGFAAAIGVLCILQGLDKNYDNVKEAQVVAPLIRFAVKFMSVGSQIQSGQEVNVDQLSQLSSYLYDNSTDKNDPYAGTSWSDAESQRAEEINAGDTGAPQTLKGSVKPDDTLTNIQKSSPLHWVENIPLINQVCSTVGGLITGILGGGVVGTIAGEVIAQIPQVKALIGVFMDTITQWMMGRPVTAFPSGGQTGNYLNFGAELAANSQAITAGGSALSQDQVAQLDHDENSILSRQFADSSLSNRLFNATNPRSLLGRIISHQNPSITNNVSHMASSFTNIWHVFADIPATIFGHQAMAANNVNLQSIYGFPEYGFSDSDMQQVGDPLDNANKAATLLDNNDKNGEPDYITRAKECFNVRLVSTKNSDGTNSWDVQINSDQMDVYNQDYAKLHCDDNSSDWRTIRFFVFDTETMKSAACYQGDDESCNDMNFNGNAGNSGSSGGSGNTNVPTGNTKQLAQQVLENPNFIPNTIFGVNTKSELQEIAKTGHEQGCGLDPAIDPNLMKYLLMMMKNYKVQIGVMNKGHCLGGLTSDHNKGEAVDLNKVESLDGKQSTTFNTSNYNNAISRKFITDSIAALTALGHGNVNQDGPGQCVRPQIPLTPQVGWWPDSCTHLHIGVGPAYNK